jgi:MmyB-like transcription regulator ligand binding domain
VDDHLFQLGLAEPVLPGSAQVAAQLLDAAVGDQRSAGDQAAVTRAEFRPGPDITPAAPAPPRQRRSKTSGVTDGIQQILDAITDAPAWVRNARHDMLAANRLGRALYAPVLSDPRRPANNARFVYLDPTAREFFADWERAADDIAAMLRSEAGSNPHDKQLVELIGELSTRSEEFRTRWAAHNVRFHRTGHKRIHHPVVGTLDLNFEAMEFPAHPGLTLLAYTAAAGTPTADSLKMLASWAATAEQAGDLPAHA